MARLRLRLLGPLQVTLDSEPVTRFETQKDRALLAYVAAEAGRPHRRELLAEMLWPNRPEGAARANLRHTLAKLRAAIGDRARFDKPDAAPALLLATRVTIQLNHAADVWVDSVAFSELLEGPASGAPPPTNQLEDAVELYRGSFLDDISVPDSATFQEWVLLKREQFHRQTLNALCRLTQYYEIRGMYECALEHAWRRVGLEPWDEQGHRQVMRLLTLDGRRGEALAQYEACCRLLAQELNAEPEIETTELFERIRDDRLEIPTRTVEPPLVFAPPGFLEEREEEVERPVFVARERELARLGGFLEQALNGQGCVVLITGGPGQGKTALLDEFAKRAMDEHPHLLVARGVCSAYAGVGDPYLPFRDVLAVLTGDVEARWAAGSITRDHARRLWHAVPLAIGALLSYGTSLVGTVLEGEALLARAAALPDRAHRLERLRARTGRSRTGPPELEQSFLFEQYTDVLHALADKHPLILVLDDVQWADRASISLLFHLGRRLARRRILIACAYRPLEVILGRDGQRHPLEKVLHEFKRTFGDVWLDLDRADPAEGRRFVDAFLDTEPNRLGKEFRSGLYQRTDGHPLFTIELLRAMQERGNLVRDAADGAWVEGPTLDWEKLPARVEAVIEQRVGRLDPELQDIVSVASVEGEVFTAQVVAAVRGMAEVPLLRRLAQELEGQHRLVREQAEVQVGPRRIAQYQFGHILVQNHLYQHLGSAERRLLHRKVAAALEDLYEGQEEKIAVQLAHHFKRAGDRGRAFRYLLLAAENAARSYANDEAIVHYTRAIEIADGGACDAASLARAHRGRGMARETLGEFELARADHETAVRVAGQAPDHRLKWRALLDLGKLWASRDYQQTRAYFEQALELARRLDDPILLAGSLNWMGNWYANAEDLAAALECHREALECFEDGGDWRGVATTLDLLGIASLLGGDVIGSVGYYDRAIALFRDLDDQPSLASSLTGRGHAGGTAYSSLAVVSPTTPIEGQRDFEEAMHIARDIDCPACKAWVLWSLGLLHMVQGRFGQALDAVHRGLAIASDIGHREWIVGNQSVLGVIHLELLTPETARRQLEQALTRAEELQSQHWIHHIAGALAAAYRLLDDLAQAQTYLETVLSARTSMDTLHRRYCWTRRAELALAQDNPALALDIADRLIASAPGISPGRVITFLWKLKGEALGALGHAEDGGSLLRAAIENATATGERFLLWRLHASLGRLYCALGRQSEAERELSTAHELVAELADTLPHGDLRDNFLQRAHERLATSP